MPGVGNGNLLQYSCLKNSMDRGAWQATVQGVTKSQTRLSDWAHTHTHSAFRKVKHRYITTCSSRMGRRGKWRERGTSLRTSHYAKAYAHSILSDPYNHITRQVNFPVYQFSCFVLIKDLFIYLWLHWLFVDVHRLLTVITSLVGEHRL